MSLPPMYSTYCTYHKLPTTKSPPQTNHRCLINIPPNQLHAQPFASPWYRESNAKVIKSKLQELTEGCSKAWRQWQQCMVMITCHTLDKKEAVWAPASSRGLPTSTNTMTMPTFSLARMYMFLAFMPMATHWSILDFLSWLLLQCICRIKRMQISVLEAVFGGSYNEQLPFL